MTDDKKEPEEEQKPKFKIVDRRRIHDDAELLEEEEEEVVEDDKAKKEPENKKRIKPESEKVKTEDKDKEKKSAEIDPLGYMSVILSILQTITSVTFVHLGLVPNPQSKIVAKKLEEARRLINLFENIWLLVQTELAPEINTELERHLQDLKASYVNQLSN